jgi:ankyrin repeat protein
MFRFLSNEKQKISDPYEEFLLAVKFKKQRKLRKLYNPLIHTWMWAAKGKHICVLEWLNEYGEEECSPDVIDWASYNGNLEIIKWLHSHGKQCTDAAINYAATNGHFEVVKYLIEQGKNCESNVMDSMAHEGNLEMVKFLHSYGKTCTNAAIDYAAMNGHFETLIWLYQNVDNLCSINTMEHAALSGHTEIVIWLQKHKVPITDKAIADAISANHIEIAEFLQLCKEKDNTMRFVCENGYLHLAKLLYQSGEYEFTPEMIELAKLNNHNNIITWFELISQKNNNISIALNNKLAIVLI